jgi:tetraacyldisaccharide 4'-kinase
MDSRLRGNDGGVSSSCLCMSIADRLVVAWYAPHLTPLTTALAPLSIVFRSAVALRRVLYRRGLLRAERLPVPIVVVGNLTVGGSGKTPLTIALARALAERGWRPGIISGGYGGAARLPRAVEAGSTPDQVGDEPTLLARTGLPVWVGRDRPAVARALLAAHRECNVVIADDGLQHYAMARTVEIAVVDASRGFGNGFMLPAGPLREPASRLDKVDAVVRLMSIPESRATRISARQSTMSLVGDSFVRVDAPAMVAAAASFRGAGVHALAGIGNPERFFEHLRSLGINARCHAFPDHHRFTPADLALADATAILMTEKDAVKCVAFADDRCWTLPVRAVIDASLVTLIEERLRGFQTA